MLHNKSLPPELLQGLSYMWWLGVPDDGTLGTLERVEGRGE